MTKPNLLSYWAFLRIGAGESENVKHGIKTLKGRRRRQEEEAIAHEKCFLKVTVDEKIRHLNFDKQLLLL